MVALSVLPEVKGRYNPLNVEKWVLEFWQHSSIPSKVREHSWKRDAPLFRFLEGPPTANGFMHVGHARGRTFKDIVLRYMRMKGYRVWDQGGWDTQGLPVEIEVEKNHGFRSKKDIEVFGVEKFIEECQKLVDYYIDHWRRASERLALWLDYNNAYQTRDPRYIETAWHFLKMMWERGYLYEDLRVVAVCPRCGTALSSHEVAQGYKVVRDPSLYFKVPLADEPSTYMIAWTTKPWTIISNEALAVHPDEIYVKLRVGNEVWILAEKRLEVFVKEARIASYEIIGKLRGRDLYGKKYIHPLLDEVPKHREHREPCHTVLHADWVSMEEGTGVVHVAPAHGPEDFELGRKHGLVVFRPIDKSGVFTSEAGKYAGLWFRDANSIVIEDLKRKGLVVHVGEIEHEYPHCWRCETPLMYYADRQWFIRVDPIKEIMLKENEGIQWRPEWAGKRFHDWLANARDWCVSRERYWGTPLPIWTCTKCGYRLAVGSLDELKRRALNPEDVVDPHRPWIDRVRVRCPKCNGEMLREPYVVDVWLDSGIAHTAALHQYGKDDLFNMLFPYDWITEALDQTRGWFYTLMFTSVAMYGRAPYRTVLCQGHVLDKYGKKMSKSRGNVIWALDFMEKFGADLLRLYLTTKAAPWDSINFDPDEVPEIRRQLDILWNSTNFALTYMGIDKWSPATLNDDLKHMQPEDKWLVFELHKLIETVEKHMQNYDLHLAARAVLDFIVEKLSHRYITLVRPRVWIEENVPEKRAVYATLYLALRELLKVLAPFAPYISEYLYQAFVRKLDPKNSKESIHLEGWPKIPANLLDEASWKAVSDLLEVAENILAARMRVGIKRRWPIKRAIVVVPSEHIDPYRQASHVLKVYANVKTVEIITKGTSLDVEGLEKVSEEPLEVYVDLRLDEETLLEGLARDVVRRIQVYRKELNLPIDAIVKRVELYSLDATLRKAIEVHREYIARETRAAEIILLSEPPQEGKKWHIEDRELIVRVQL